MHEAAGRGGGMTQGAALEQFEEVPADPFRYRGRLLINSGNVILRGRNVVVQFRLRNVPKSRAVLKLNDEHDGVPRE